VALLGPREATDEALARLALEGDRVAAAAHVDHESLDAAGPDAFDAVLVHVPEGSDVVACVRECIALVPAPIVAACDRLTPGILYAALEAGAADCVTLAAPRGLPSAAEVDDEPRVVIAAPGPVRPGSACPPRGPRPGPLTLALFRAAAMGARRGADLRRVQDLAAALARSRAECEDARASAITDAATGLFNKRHFHDRLDEEENKAWRTGQPIALILLDIDHFKAVNDSYGHDVGDRVLRGAAQVIRHCTRNYDIACRFGGEEFAVILPATRADRALHVAERMRLDLRAHVFDGAPAALRVSTSCGIADLPGPRVSSKDELVRAADRALYKAKSLGRDRTCVAEEVEGVAGGGAAAAAAALGIPIGEERDLAGLSLTEAAALTTLSKDVLDRVDRLRRAIRGLSEELTQTYERAVQTLVSLVDDGAGPRVFGSAAVVARYAERIASAMDVGAENVERIRRAGLLQELGMLPLAGRLVHGGALNASDQELVRRHPALSVRIADELGYLKDELPIILHHHENFDGTGYPRGLKGDRIPLGSRILAVAMAFEAMTSDRPYRRPLAARDAIAEIARLTGTRYDPHVVKGFQAAFAGGQ